MPRLSTPSFHSSGTALVKSASKRLIEAPPLYIVGRPLLLPAGRPQPSLPQCHHAYLCGCPSLDTRRSPDPSAAHSGGQNSLDKQLLSAGAAPLQGAWPERQLAIRAASYTIGGSAFDSSCTAFSGSAAPGAMLDAGPTLGREAQVAANGGQGAGGQRHPAAQVHVSLVICKRERDGQTGWRARVAVEARSSHGLLTQNIADLRASKHTAIQMNRAWFTLHATSNPTSSSPDGCDARGASSSPDVSVLGLSSRLLLGSRPRQR